MELAAAGEDMKKLREIARAHIARCETGDMQAIRELADRLDGKPAQMLDLGDADEPRLNKIVHEFVHVAPMSADEISAAEAKGEAVRPIRR
jgi:hypothetical protein